MDPTTADLKYDHEVLRGKLTTLEHYFPCFCVAPFTVGILTDALAVYLRAHTEREERWLDRAMHPPYEAPSPALQRLHDEHENQRTHLAVLHQLITEGNPADADHIMSQAQCLITELRQHMAVEERELFPLIDQQAARAETADTGMGAGAEAEAELVGIS